MALTKIQLSQLLSVYGKLLTDKQREALTMYCDCDCSLAEIADELSISRQGVRDAILKGETTLIKLEEALSLSELQTELSAAVEREDINEVYEVAKRFVTKE